MSERGEVGAGDLRKQPQSRLGCQCKWKEGLDERGLFRKKTGAAGTCKKITVLGEGGRRGNWNWHRLGEMRRHPGEWVCSKCVWG